MVEYEINEKFKVNDSLEKQIIRIQKEGKSFKRNHMSVENQFYAIDEATMMSIYRRLPNQEYGCECASSPYYWYDKEINELYEVITSEEILIPTFTEESYWSYSLKRQVCNHCDQIITNIPLKYFISIQPKEGDD